MTRILVAGLVVLGAASVVGPGCTADLEDHCVSGPCGPDAQPVFNPATTGAGGGGGGCQEMFPATGDYPCVVWEVVHARCHCCHQDPPQGGAPFPLLTYENTREIFGATTKQKWQRMSEVYLPSGLPHMPFDTAKQLTDDQKKTLADWFAACAPPADQYQDGGAGCDNKMPPPPPNADMTPGCELE